MSLKEQMMTGKLYVEWGHASREDQVWEQETSRQRQAAKDACFEYNHTRPTDLARKREILAGLLGRAGKNLWMEANINFAYGCNTYFGDNVYANFNLTVVDDGEVHIGDSVMFAPNVTITTTGHPVHPSFRDKGAQFSLPVHIGSHTWIGSNVVIMPGVTIGENSVIGAGSVVTRDIPANVVAFGAPCRVARPITDADLKEYKKGYPVNEDWEG